MSRSRYVLGPRLGEGTSAEVFEAYLQAEDGFRRRVAIKRARGRDWNDEERARFVGEARVASALHHANVAAVLDYGFFEGGLPYLVTELVEGLDVLALRRAANAMPEEIALIIAVDIAHALAYVHAARDQKGRALEIIHRDLSPSNVLVSWNGDVKLTDFGVARGAERASQTITGTIKGTPAFMAPEQLLSAHLDARADVFALGCLIHWMLTGASPMEREDQRRRVLGGAAVTIAESISPELKRILARVLVAARHQRAQGGAKELAAELGTVMLARLKKDPRSTLLAWLAKHPLAPSRGGELFPQLVTDPEIKLPVPSTLRIEPKDLEEEHETLLAISPPPALGAQPKDPSKKPRR